MNILFYVEPLIERGCPYWKIAWASEWSFRMAQTLDNGENDFYIALSDALSERFNNDVIFTKKVVFSQKELLKPFPGGYLEASAAWYMRSYTDAQMMYYTRLMADKFSSVMFDVIITWTPVPFLAKLYPDAKIFHMEYSIFSRKPFPQTWYLDCCGMFEYSFLHKYQKEIQDIELDEKQTALVRALQEASMKFFEKNNIFTEKIQNLRKKFKYLVLLPLQFSQYYSFDCLTGYKNQFDFLCGCLDDIPEDIGVIFTMHPEHLCLDEDAIHYVINRYKHAIFLSNSKIVYAASQYIMPYVDGVITISSSLGLQSLIFKKKLFAIGKRNMEYIADAKNLHNMYKILSEEIKDKNNILYFIITKYAIPENYLFNKEWLLTFIKKSCVRNIDHTFYDFIDDPEKIFKDLLCNITLNDHIIENSAVLDNKVKYLKGEEKSMEKSTTNGIFLYSPYKATGFFLKNGEYVAENIIIPDTSFVNGIYTVKFSITDKCHENKFRFDPLEGQAATIIILEIDTDICNYKIVPLNSNYSKENIYSFYTDDPMFEIEGDFSSATYLTIRYIIEEISIDILYREISNAKKDLIELQLMQKSMSWKMTAPLRKLKRWFT